MKRIRGSIWRNKKFKGRTFVGTYRWVRKEREFILREVGRKPSACRNISFESYQMARKVGWRKNK